MRIEYMHQWCPICQLKMEIINLHDSTSCMLITSCLTGSTAPCDAGIRCWFKCRLFYF